MNHQASPFPIDMSYCGPAPAPADLWSRWNLDPLLLLGFALAILAMFALARPARREALAFWAGLGVLFVAFVSPLCALTVALFSARVGHHLLLVAVAAPLLALALGRHLGFAARLLGPLFALHAVVFWLWHAPDAYALALSDHGAYWLMQASLLGTAVPMWAGIFRAEARGRALLALLGTTIQMGLLGALLVFANAPLYVPHLATTGAFGLDPLSDQQLAGLLMWVPASLPYLGIALWLVFDSLGARPAGRTP